MTHSQHTKRHSFVDNNNAVTCRKGSLNESVNESERIFLGEQIKII